MPRYSFSAISADGASVSGEIDAIDQLSALDMIAARGLTPINLTEGGSDGPWWNRDIQLLGKPRKAKSTELEQFFNAFASLMHARLPLSRSLGFCAAQARKPAMRRALETMRSDVENGQSLAAAMRNADQVIPERFATIIELGERSDQIEYAARQAADMLRRESKIAQELTSALLYPVILILMSVLVLMLVVFYLTPTLLPVFASSGAEAPAVLRIMENLRIGLVTGWPVLLIIGFLIILSSLLFRAHLSRALSGLFLRLPITGQFIRQRESQRICQMLALLLSSGAILTAALTTVRKATHHPSYKALLTKTEETVIAGGSLSSSLAQSPLIDDLARTMIDAGEESDRLADVLNTAANTLAGQTSETINRAVKLLTPLLTLIIGVGVGAVILSTISAILDLNDVAF